MASETWASLESAADPQGGPFTDDIAMDDVNDSVELAPLSTFGSDAISVADPPGSRSSQVAAGDGSSSDTESDSTANDEEQQRRRLPRPQWPPSFCCPITQEPMHDPVVAMDGHSYESAVISEWLREHQTSPVNGDRLASKVLVRNVALRNAMAEWDELVRQTSGAAGAEPEPESEPEPEHEHSGATDQPSASNVLQLDVESNDPSDRRGAIVFEPQTEWEDLAARRRQRSTRTGGPGGGRTHGWLNRACMLLMMCSLALACYTMYVEDPWDPDQFPPGGGGGGGGDDPHHRPPPAPPQPRCFECLSEGCCPRCPPPWERHWFAPVSRLRPAAAIHICFVSFYVARE
jgi:hypothetical protein|eukprot:COSAG06_NODE_1560_length_9104_cov_82.958468_2_plen_347_part_00